MKKMVFALQVFGFVATVPLYVITELARSPVSLAHTTTSNINRESTLPVSNLLTDNTAVFAWHFEAIKSN